MKHRLTVFVQLLPVILSMLMLSAHYLRYSAIIEMVICLLLPFVLLFRRKISVRILQFALLVAAVIWIDTTLNLVAIREQVGYAWTRMAFILGGVAFFSIGSCFMFYTKTLRTRYGIEKGF